MEKSRRTLPQETCKNQRAFPENPCRTALPWKPSHAPNTSKEKDHSSGPGAVSPGKLGTKKGVLSQCSPPGLDLLGAYRVVEHDRAGTSGTAGEMGVSGALRVHDAVTVPGGA